MGRQKTTKARMQKAKTIEKRWELFNEWVSRWQNEQRWVLRCLNEAICNHNHDDITIYCGQLRAITEKKFETLFNMLPLLQLDVPAWLENWKDQQNIAVSKLGAAAYTDSHEKINEYVNIMRELTKKEFPRLDKLRNENILDINS